MELKESQLRKVVRQEIRNALTEDDGGTLSSRMHCGSSAERIRDYSQAGKTTMMVRCSNVSDCPDWTTVGAKTRDNAGQAWNELHS